MTSPLSKNLAALVTALIFAGIVNFILGRIGLLVVGADPDPMTKAGIFVVLMFVLTPIAAGAALGLFAVHPVALAIPLVLLSLSVTYLSLGPSGLPAGWKIVEYVIQAGIVAATAFMVSTHRRRRTPGVTPPSP